MSPSEARWPARRSQPSHQRRGRRSSQRPRAPQHWTRGASRCFQPRCPKAAGAQTCGRAGSACGRDRRDARATRRRLRALRRPPHLRASGGRMRSAHATLRGSGRGRFAATRGWHRHRGSTAQRPQTRGSLQRSRGRCHAPLRQRLRDRRTERRRGRRREQRSQRCRQKRHPRHASRYEDQSTRQNP